ncbi:hypothetical protein [Streptomyces sp. SudanB182_2057]|uniref:hypothetical protein n=1 Tax=Streptomyces sp. SudanB182_2057 TaxID=3035281 RepID=UPI003F54F259
MDDEQHRPGEPASWALPDSHWHDMVGRTRAQRVAGHLAAFRALGDQPAAEGDKWWISEAVDTEAVEVGYMMLDSVAPTGPPDRDRVALASLEALTAINDSYAACEHYEDIFGKHLFGRTVDSWLMAATEGADWARDGIREALRVQYETLAGQRRDRVTREAVARQVQANASDYREYLRWRDAEGCFYGVLLCCAVAAGVDLRQVPRARVVEALEGGIVAFDVHSMVRHRAEDETGDIFRYLPGGHGEQVDTALALVRALYTDLIHADDLGDREKELLLRYVTSGALLPYLVTRWSRTTPLHAAPVNMRDGWWTHVVADSRHVVGYSELAGTGEGGVL